MAVKVSDSEPGQARGSTAPEGICLLADACLDPAVDECDIACDAMPGFVEGDLAAPDRDWISEHVEECSYCQDQLDGYVRLEDLLTKLPTATPQFADPPTVRLAALPRAGYARMASPIGPLLVAVSDHGVCEISFAREESERSFRCRLIDRGFRPEPDPADAAEAIGQLDDYFSGSRTEFNLSVDLSGITPFTREVLSATTEVPFGGLSTYRDIARRIGKPAAARAVGNALGSNPVPVIVPCHRIVRADRSIGGYTGGLDIKMRLLTIEGVAFPA